MIFGCRSTGILFFLLTLNVQHPAFSAPLNYFGDVAGPASRSVMTLGWVLAAICIAVCVIIAVLLLTALSRRRKAPEEEYIEEDEKSAVRWIIFGVALSTITLLGMTVYTLITLNRVVTPPEPPALEITVIGHNWWWEIIYYEDEPESRFVTANEIHIPVGKPVLIKLKSADVIHAIWVPKLAGKTQTIPGVINRQWLQADKPGRYRGICAQFCGEQHAHMAFEVVAHERGEFRRWQEEQRRPAPAPTTPQALQGRQVFVNRCAACHMVNGSGAGESVAPDLTHLQSRRLIAAGMLENTNANLSRWITHAQDIKPGVYMPNIDLYEKEHEALMSYLETLK